MDLEYTHLALVIDRSGSMTTIKDDMEGGIKTLLDEQAALPGTLLIDVTTFDTTVEFPYSDVTAKDIKTEGLIVPRGGTALFDGVGKTITRLGEKLAKLDEDDRPAHVLVVIVTDGQENSSVEWSQANLKKSIQEQTEKFSWDFIFLGANIDSATVGGGFGLNAAQTMNYTADADGTSSVLRSASAYVTQTRSGLKAVLEEESK